MKVNVLSLSGYVSTLPKSSDLLLFMTKGFGDLLGLVTPSTPRSEPGVEGASSVFAIEDWDEELVELS